MKPDSWDTNQGSLGAPHFDAQAAARAKPVQQIRPNRFSNISSRFKSLPNRISGQMRALLVVVAVGLITGAVAGMLLVNAARSNQPAVEISATTNEVSEMPVGEAKTLDAFAGQLSSEVSRPGPSSQHRRVKRPAAGGPRAYRVAVIR